MAQEAKYTFDPVDIAQMRLRASLSPARRIQVMLDARELAVGLMRGRMRKRYPDLSDMVHQYLDLDPEVSRSFDEVNIDRQARKMGVETLHLWDTIKKASLKESGGV